MEFKLVKGIFCGAALSLFTMAPVQAAFNDAGTDYSSDTATSWIEMGEVMEPMNMVDMLLCIMASTGANLVVNGTYLALVDINQCQRNSESNAPELVNVTVTTSREDNTSPQIVNVWFDESPSTQYLVETTISEGPTDTSPFGSFSFAWQSAIDADDKGTMEFIAGTDTTEIKMAINDVHGGPGISFNWMHAEVTNDGDSGTAKVGIDTDDYVLNFDKVGGGHVNYQKNTDAEVCYDRSNLTTYVYDYNLYDIDTGARKELNGGFECTYTSGDETTYCHIGPWGAWFDGGESDGDRPTTVTHDDGTEYTGITYDDEDANNDGLRIVVPGYTFDDPLVFDKTDQTAGVQSEMGSNSYLNYFGAGQLHGLPWACSTDGRASYHQDDHAGNCDGAVDWRPLGALTDGTVLTQSGTSAQYVSKGVVAMKVMSIDPGACSALDLTGIAGNFSDLSASDISPVTITWADKPEVAASPTVINGELQ